MYENLKAYNYANYKRMFREPTGNFAYRCLLPAGAYATQLWDWGCWTSNIALRQIATNHGEQESLFEYEKGCVLNFIASQREDGYIPIVISTTKETDLNIIFPHKNIHKPCLASHIAFIMKYNSDISWVNDIYPNLERFIEYYEKTSKHESGLFFFLDDFAIGTDNDPSVWYKPHGSVASILLNSLMYKELEAMEYIAVRLGLEDKANKYYSKREELKKAINDCCYDEKDGMYYSVDLNLAPIAKEGLHSGSPREYSTILIRIGFIGSFMPLWAGIPNEEQVKRIVEENLTNEKSFWSPYGVRSLSKQEKMFKNEESFNPSCWLGPVWILTNYFIIKGLLKYGYKKVADELIDKTIDLLDNDIKTTGRYHEDYHSEEGYGMPKDYDFLSWDLLCENLIALKEGKEVIEEL